MSEEIVCKMVVQGEWVIYMGKHIPIKNYPKDIVASSAYLILLTLSKDNIPQEAKVIKLLQENDADNYFDLIGANINIDYKSMVINE